uniref:uncharacterized protein LOC104265675 n=1 Tax=Ciona intestinalis TaxID=7719 RepID=UPI00089DD593|nr:uncharacterized protein LOC104265675 [Ciona intestinalis]|eukprot:XP_009858504.2 uncharacterized protein LOC104265675 [Ciona intestinalis]
MGRPLVVKRVSKRVDVNQGKLGGTESSYQKTFIKHEDFVPSQTLKPPPEKAKVQHPPMQTMTTTMKSYASQDLSAKREIIKPIEEHVVPDEPLSNVTMYRHDFAPKSALPAILMRPKTNSDQKAEPVKFDGRTMNKYYYQDWKPKMKQRFGELPAFTSPLIYPDRNKPKNIEELTKSRTHTDYPYKSMPKPEMAKVAAANIKVGEGNHDLKTTHRETYQFVKPSSAVAISPKPGSIVRQLAQRKMEFNSKYQADFPQREKYPLPPKAATPAPDTLDIKMNHDLVFDTEQRNCYQGWNVKEHPRPGLSKLVDNTQLSTDAMQTNTTMTRDFTPKEIPPSQDISANRPQTNRGIERGKFYSTTANKAFYQDWGAKPRRRFGDFHENYKEIMLPKKLLPMLEHSTTTKSTFVEKYGRPRTSMKPNQKTIDVSQPHDFNTISGMCYK